MTKALYTQVGEVKGKEIPDQVTFTHQFTPSSETLKNARGSLFALITLYGDHKKATELEKDIFQTFHSSYYSSSLGSNLNALGLALDQTNKIIAEKGPPAAMPPKFDLVAAVLWGEALYIVRTENVGVIFQREKVTKRLKFDKTASGAVKDGDTVCLVNQRFLEKVDLSSLSPVLSIEEFQGILKSLSERVRELEGVAGLVLRIYVEEPKQESLEMVEIGEKQPVKLSSIKEDIIKKILALGERINPLVTTVKRRLATAFFWIWGKISEPWRSREPGQIEDPAKRRRARVAQIAVVLIILLTISIGAAYINRANSAKLARFNEKLSLVEAKLNEIENLTSINPERSKDLLSSVEQDLIEAKKFNIREEKLSDLEIRFKALSEDVRKIYEPALEDFYSFGGQTKINILIQTDTSFIILDRERSKVLLVDKSSKKEKEFLAEPGINVIASFDNMLYLQGDKGVKKFDLGSGSVANLLGSSSEWGQIIKADTYQRNLYLLDKEKKEVWKYVAAGTALASPQSYFKSGKPDLGTPSAITIDGLVWVGNQDGAVFKFLGGREQKFEINGLDKPFGEIADIHTTVGGNSLFILDKTNKRVVLVAKDGDYLSQYTSEEFGQVVSLAADEKNKRVYIGVGNIIKSFKYK